DRIELLRSLKDESSAPSKKETGAAAKPPGSGPQDKLPFRVPFVAERVARPPVVEYPMTANFDEHGRLFVAHAAGLNVRSPEVLLKELSNSIRSLAPAAIVSVFAEPAGRRDGFDRIFISAIACPFGLSPLAAVEL